MGESFQIISIGSLSGVVAVVASNFLFFLCILTTNEWVELYNTYKGRIFSILKIISEVGVAGMCSTS